MGYLRDLGIQRDVIVTDGIRYRLYAAQENFAPAGSMNLARLKHPALQMLKQIERSSLA